MVQLAKAAGPADKAEAVSHQAQLNHLDLLHQQCYIQHLVQG